MSSRPASLLTKTQRRRIRDEFAELNEQQRRRDQRQIRERIRAGAFDFEPLAAYPDRQLELAFEDVPDDDAEATVVNATLFVERLRVLTGVERDEVLTRASARANELTAESDGLGSLGESDLRTEAEIRREAEAAVSDRFAANPWDERADGLLKLAAGAALPLFGVSLTDAVTSQNLIGTSTFVALIVYLCLLVVAVALAGVLLIKGAQTLKHDVVPWVRLLRRNPAGAFRGVVDWLRRPGAKLRRVWEEL